MVLLFKEKKCSLQLIKYKVPFSQEIWSTNPVVVWKWQLPEAHCGFTPRTTPSRLQRCCTTFCPSKLGRNKPLHHWSAEMEEKRVSWSYMEGPSGITAHGATRYHRHSILRNRVNLVNQIQINNYLDLLATWCVPPSGHQTVCATLRLIPQASVCYPQERNPQTCVPLEQRTLWWPSLRKPIFQRPVSSSNPYRYTQHVRNSTLLT